MANALDQLLAAARARIERLAAVDVPAAIADGAVLVDIRTAEQRRRDGVIAGSIWYPRNCLEWRCAPDAEHRDPLVAEASGPVLLLCKQGYQTSLAAATLCDLGVRAGDVIGGFAAWVEAGLPVEAHDPARHGMQGSERASIRDY